MSNIPDSAKKEDFSIQYVEMLSSSCSYEFVIPRHDYDSIDGSITCGEKPAPDSVLSSCQLNVQLKSYSLGAHCKVDLKNKSLKVKVTKKTYDELKKESQAPRIFIVFVLPSDKVYLTEYNHSTVLHGRAYWTTTWQLPEIKTRSKTISIPLKNKFNSRQLKKFMYQASLGKRVVL